MKSFKAHLKPEEEHRMLPIVHPNDTLGFFSENLHSKQLQSPVLWNRTKNIFPSLQALYCTLSVSSCLLFNLCFFKQEAQFSLKLRNGNATRLRSRQDAFKSTLQKEEKHGLSPLTPNKHVMSKGSACSAMEMSALYLGYVKSACLRTRA